MSGWKGEWMDVCKNEKFWPYDQDVWRNNFSDFNQRKNIHIGFKYNMYLYKLKSNCQKWMQSKGIKEKKLNVKND